MYWHNQRFIPSKFHFLYHQKVLKAFLYPKANWGAEAQLCSWATAQQDKGGTNHLMHKGGTNHLMLSPDWYNYLFSDVFIGIRGVLSSVCQTRMKISNKNNDAYINQSCSVITSLLSPWLCAYHNGILMSFVHLVFHVTAENKTLTPTSRLSAELVLAGPLQTQSSSWHWWSLFCFPFPLTPHFPNPRCHQTFFLALLLSTPLVQLWTRYLTPINKSNKKKIHPSSPPTPQPTYPIHCIWSSQKEPNQVHFWAVSKNSCEGFGTSLINWVNAGI